MLPVHSAMHKYVTQKIFCSSQQQQRKLIKRTENKTLKLAFLTIIKNSSNKFTKYEIAKKYTKVTDYKEINHFW